MCLSTNQSRPQVGGGGLRGGYKQSQPEAFNPTPMAPHRAVGLQRTPEGTVGVGETHKLSSSSKVFRLISEKTN